MKFSRILALCMVAVMLVLSCASCAATAPTINVTLKITPNVDPEFPTLLEVQVPIKSENPTGLEAFVEGCIVNQVDYALTDDELSVLDIDEYPDIIGNDGVSRYWIFTLNGVEPEKGRASDIAIKDGDVIEYIYVEYIPEDTAAK